MTTNTAGKNEALYQFDILDSSPESEFDNIAEMATHATGTTIALLVFFDQNRWWLKAKFGTDANAVEIPSPAISRFFYGQDYVCISDINNDASFAGEQLLLEGQQLGMIAGAAIHAETGHRVGYLIIADKQPKSLSAIAQSCLKMLADQASTLLKLRSNLLKLRKIEQEYKSSDEQINTIFQNSIDAVIVIDDNGQILQWNPKAVVIFGWTPEETIGRDFNEIIIQPQFRQLYLETMKLYDRQDLDSNSNKTIELDALRKNGTKIDIAIGISPTVIKGKRYYINFISDITERKLVTKRLDKQKEFYENILNQLPADIAVFDADHKYLFVNPGAISDPELRKYIVGKDDFQYAEYRNRDKSVAQIRRDQFMEIKNSGKEIRWEDTVKDPYGRPITHLRRLFPVHDEKGELYMVIGFGIDITDRKIMEVKQAALVQQLSTQNTQLIDFCNIVSHNLRAPLVNMSMLVDFIKETEDLAEQNMLVNKLKPVLDNLHTTFNELVESIQIKQDLEIKFEKNNLGHVMQRTIEGLKTEISKSGAVIEANFENAPNIYCPPKYLFSIFHNLVSNSLKYQSPKRPPVIRIATEKVNGKILLTVADNGLGIDMTKHKDNIFKIGKVFHRHPNAKGFGLFMTRTQVEAMDGKIWAESTPGEGSTFFIEFKNQK